MPPRANIVTALSAALGAIGDEVAGASGAQVRALRGTDAPVVGLARGVLDALARALIWLVDVVDRAGDGVRAADALAALLELAGEVVDALDDLTTRSGEVPEAIKSPMFADFLAMLGDAQQAMRQPPRLPGALPTLDELAALRAALGRLLGERPAPDFPRTGLLGDLRSAIADAH